MSRCTGSPLRCKVFLWWMLLPSISWISGGGGIQLAIAFSTGTNARRRSAAFSKHFPTTLTTTTQLQDKNNNEAEGWDGGELTSALARLDKQWQMQRKEKKAWEKVVLEEEEEKTGFLEKDFFYLLEPPAISTPSCLILFLGGAGLGQFPHIVYSELLGRVSRRLNAAVICAPYQLASLDHFELSKKAGELLRKAVIYVEDERGYSPKLPTYALTHSLGGKLQTITMAATGMGQDLAGVGLMSYNNFGFSQTIGMARSFAKTIQQASSSNSDDEATSPPPGDAADASPFVANPENVLNSILDFAQQAVGMVGLEFSPSPLDTERIIEMKYDADLQEKTRLFVFDDDDLDSSESFMESCWLRADGIGPSVSGLPGTHLTPVYLKYGLEDFPMEARDIASQMSGGFQSASFGNEEDLNKLVDEICSWILGKGPSREPRWGRQEAGSGTKPPKLSGTVVDADVQ